METNHGKNFSKKVLAILGGLFVFGMVSTYNACAPGGFQQSGSGSNNNRGINIPGGNGGGGNDQLAGSVGETFFNNVVVPMMQQDTQCFSCHAAPRFGGTAPLSIYEYRFLRNLLVNGGGSTDNDLIKMMTNENAAQPHPGGNRCSLFGMSESPCKEIVEWHQQETNTSAVPGALDVVTGVGFAKGWAADFNDAARSVTVNFYLGAANNAGGQLLGSAVANKVGPSGGFPGNHAFEFPLDVALRDGSPRQLYAYGVDENGQEAELQGSPFQAVAYSPSGAAMQIFNNQVSPMLTNACSACHNYNFNEAYTRLLSPTPFAGGTATNNLLYFYATGGNGHAGGNACGGNCQQLLNWWNQDF